ncbi:hypothetical protein [Trinickia fusca]|uniref:hypothetical protein n=1 Tax=Trinickia fusca TaxID=2419777 RepID=UPI001FE8D0C6|nr:hypothetical protein [Trinickia fusca]
MAIALEPMAVVFVMFNGLALVPDPADAPTATFPLPFTYCPALDPIAVLLLPVAFWPALAPLSVLLSPVALVPLPPP